MKVKKRNPRTKIPDRLAYYDGEKYHCYNTECIIVNAQLSECRRIPKFTKCAYIPILRCENCNTLYFGLETPDYEEAEIIKQEIEKRKQAEEERRENARILAEMDEEAFYQEEQRRERALREELYKEIIKHENELAGDIILPDIITGTTSQRHTPRDDEPSEGDIILPNILTN